MATKSFIDSSDLESAKKKLFPPKEIFWGVRSGREDRDQVRHSTAFSAWLSGYLLNVMQEAPGWEEVGAIALGSWARGELCPMSDVDVLFCGKEKAVKVLVDDLHEKGVKLRYRVPEDPSDWTVGVEPFDVLAILAAKPLDKKYASTLEKQQQMIRSRGYAYKRKLYRTILVERKKRAQRYDSIASYLEPNIKFGPGGLRDLQQALTILNLFPDKFPRTKKVESVLENYKHFFLTIRHKTHIDGAGDLIAAPEQVELAKWFGFADVKSFMREVQQGLSAVSFYADWVAEETSLSRKNIDLIAKKKLGSLRQIFLALEDSDSILIQERVRWELPSLFAPRNRPEGEVVGRLLSKYVSVKAKESFLISLFRSRLMEFCIPEMKKIVGLVQHDQYHRYTVDAHLLQTLKELRRVFRAKKLLGPLSRQVKELTAYDWKVLMWAGLYHDLAKARRGDHSTAGAKLVHKDFARFGFSAKFTEEVAWLVENHLILSTAAFRKNPQSKTTWRYLHLRGVGGKNLLRLAVLTAVDIRATNPDAWNGWKATLLAGLVEALRSTKATKFMRLLQLADINKTDLSREFVKGLEPFVVEQIPTKYLLEDYRQLKEGKEQLPIRIFQKKGSDIWVRFHSKKDQKALFLNYVKLLYDSGCSIVESSIETYNNYGAYNWFKVKSKRSPAQLRKVLELARIDEVVIPKVNFDRIQIMSQDESETLISFRGRDQNGVLLAAVKGLTDLGLTVKWARVHTWGRQIDDIFGVKTVDGIEDLIARLG